MLKVITAFGLTIFTIIAAIIAVSSGNNSNKAAVTIIEENSPSVTTKVIKGTLTQTDVDLWLSVLQTQDPVNLQIGLEQIEQRWQPAYVPISLEVLNFINQSDGARAILALLEAETGQTFGFQTNDWYQWLWNQVEPQITGYDNFKAQLYRVIDPKFEAYFKNRGNLARIRLDEIRWGGVLQDGIPPLRQPKMITPDEADYLDDDHIVFGIEVNGDARAYPKRILAWHEMFVDTVGGLNVAGVYCTLCGTVVLYETEVDGTNHQIGTSGFLYRSNKLMYDQATQSLWNTLKGEPVLGPLVDQGIVLPHRQVVTTTWGEWKQRHPNTKVLSLDTGHRRDYGEGVAYNEYFATDNLMFNTPFNDTRLKNKQEVLALRIPGNPKDQLAIDTEFLNKNPIYTNTINQQNFVVFTDQSGANRAYQKKEYEFVNYDRQSKVTDSTGQVWTITESALVSANGEKLPAIPYHRAFWFGWHAAFPDSRLIK